MTTTSKKAALELRPGDRVLLTRDGAGGLAPAISDKNALTATVTNKEIVKGTEKGKQQRHRIHTDAGAVQDSLGNRTFLLAPVITAPPGATVKASEVKIGDCILVERNDTGRYSPADTRSDAPQPAIVSAITKRRATEFDGRRRMIYALNIDLGPMMGCPSAYELLRGTPGVTPEPAPKPAPEDAAPTWIGYSIAHNKIHMSMLSRRYPACDNAAVMARPPLLALEDDEQLFPMMAAADIPEDDLCGKCFNGRSRNDYRNAVLKLRKAGEERNLATPVSNVLQRLHLSWTRQSTGAYRVHAAGVHFVDVIDLADWYLDEENDDQPHLWLFAPDGTPAVCVIVGHHDRPAHVYDHDAKAALCGPCRERFDASVDLADHVKDYTIIGDHDPHTTVVQTH